MPTSQPASPTVNRLTNTAAVMLAVCTVALPLITVKLAPTDIDASGLTAYNSPLVVMQSAAVFSLMLRIKRKAGKIIENIDRCSFGIYLIHMIFIRLTMKELGFDPFDYGMPAFFAAAAVYFAVSFAMTYGLKKFRLFSFL
jgi:peptidoglycan/LPS O-acetylase OafA/YrhL